MAAMVAVVVVVAMVPTMMPLIGCKIFWFGISGASPTRRPWLYIFICLGLGRLLPTRKCVHQ